MQDMQSNHTKKPDPLDPESAIRLENQLCFPVYAASRLITQSYRPFLEKLNLTYLQYLILLSLWQDDSQSVSQIGESLLLDSGTLTPALKKMEIKGFIYRKRCLQDDRRVINQLTQKAHDIKNDVAQIPVSIFCQSGFSEQEAGEFRIFAQNLLERIKQSPLHPSHHDINQIHSFN